MHDIITKQNQRKAKKWGRRLLLERGYKRNGRTRIFDAMKRAYPEFIASDLVSMYFTYRAIDVSKYFPAPLPDSQANTEYTYEQYLNSATWKKLRKKVIERDKCCVLCSSATSLNVHHRRYPDILGEEPLEWLTLLCRKCHDLFHEHRKIKRNY